MDDNTDYLVKLIESLKNRASGLLIANIELEAALLLAREDYQKLADSVKNTESSNKE